MKQLIAVALFLVAQIPVVSGKGFEPNTKWPYIYENFAEGKIYFDGNKRSESKMNIHLLGNVLHYVGPDGKIYQYNDKKINRVEIGGDAYLPFDGAMHQVVYTQGTNLVVKRIKANFDAMGSNNGAYGATTNSASTRNLSSLDLGGLNNPELGLMLQEKSDGAYVPVVTSYLFVVDGKLVSADKKGAESLLNDEKRASFKGFLKENKIKWKNEDHLKLVLDYIVKP